MPSISSKCFSQPLPVGQMIETVYPADREADVVRALRAAHPYEEPAFDVYELVS